MGANTQRLKLLLVAAAIVAWSSHRLSGGAFTELDDGLAPYDDSRRSLQAIQAFDPSPNAPRANRTVMNVYLTVTRPNPAYSIFQTDLLPRHATGRFQFEVQNGAPCDLSCQSPVFDDGPCLVVTSGRGCPLYNARCTYPTCKVMITNDEGCRARPVDLYDVREYYSDRLAGKGYLPLGPRFDTWVSLQRLRKQPGFYVKPASERRYAFNAVFSKDTHVGRGRLAELIDSQRESSPLEVFASMAKKWAPMTQRRRMGEQIDTNRFAAVILDSAFTLSPAGHNSECFRLFEAVEAGSIPVLVKSDLYVDGKSRDHPCRGALRHWYGAPILVLDSWSELYPTVSKLMETPTALDEMQANIRAWYQNYWRHRVREFEDFMIASYAEDAEATQVQTPTPKEEPQVEAVAQQ